MIMTGYNNKYGPFETKEDKKQNLIEYGRKIHVDMNSYDDPTFHAYRALFNEYLRVERLLHYEHGMSEEEIATAILGPAIG